MRFNALALALAFGVAKAVVAGSTLLPMTWMMSNTLLGNLPFGLSRMTEGFAATTMLWNFVGGVVSGGLFALIYNKIADLSAPRPVQP